MTRLLVASPRLLDYLLEEGLYLMSDTHSLEAGVPGKSLLGTYG